MRKLLMIVYFALLLSGCSTMRYLKGSYTQDIYWKDINASANQTFDKSVEYLVENGYELQTIDRPSGIITLKTTIPGTLATMERQGKASDPKKYVVYASTIYSTTAFPSLITILIRGDENKSALGVKLLTWIEQPKMPKITYSTASTGTLERNLVDNISNYSNKGKR